jgi:MFS family permease
MNNDNFNKSKPVGLRNVFAMGLVSFFTDFSTEMVLGVLPLFIVKDFGASRAILGTIEGSAELTSYALRMVSGSLSDRIGKRKIFVLIGYALSTVSKPFFVLSTAWLDIFIVRISDRMGKGIRTAPRDALIADSVSESISGKAFGIHRTIDQMGAIVGPIVAFAILQVMDIRYVFLFSLIPGAIAVIILIFFVKEVVSVTTIRKKLSQMRVFSNISSLVRENKSFAFLLIISAIFSLGAFNFSFLLLRASDLGVEESLIPIVYLVISISHTTVGIPAGILADKIGKEKVLIIGYSTFIVTTILMTAAVGGGSKENSVYPFILATAFGLYVGILETVQRAIVPKYVSSELRGTAFGLFNVVIGTSFFVSNVMFGFLWYNYSLNLASAYSLSLSFAAIIGMILFLKSSKNKQNNSRLVKKLD